MIASPLSTPMPWDLVSSDYAAELVPMFERYAERALELSNPAAGARVLDVACGPGTLSFLAARRGAVVTAIDFSPAMIEILRARAAAEQVTIDAHVGDAQSLPFGAGSFDAAYSMFGLMFFPDRARGLAEIRRVLRRDGTVVLSSWKLLPPSSPLAHVFAAIKGELPHLPANDAKPALGEPDEVRAELTAAGFGDIDVHDVTFVDRKESLEQLWSGLQRTFAPLVLLRAKLGDGWPDVRDGVRARLSEALGEGPIALEMIANVAMAR